MTDCPHDPAGYDGRCPRCGTRLVSPSQSLLDFAERNGMTVKEFTVTLKITPEILRRMGITPPAP